MRNACKERFYCSTCLPSCCVFSWLPDLKKGFSSGHCLPFELWQVVFFYVQINTNDYSVHQCREQNILYCVGNQVIGSAGTLEGLLYSKEELSNNKTELYFTGLQLF